MSVADDKKRGRKRRIGPAGRSRRSETVRAGPEAFPLTLPSPQGEGKSESSTAAVAWPALGADVLRRLTGLTDRRHRQLAESGYFRPPIRGVYGEDAIPGLFKYFTEQLHKKDDNLAQERFKLTRAKRETAQEELALLRERYVEKAEIGPSLRNVALQQRSALQRKLESELAPKLAGMQTPEILALLQGAVDEICGIFQDGIRKWCEAGADAPEIRIPKAEGRIDNGPGETAGPTLGVHNG